MKQVFEQEGAVQKRPEAPGRLRERPCLMATTAGAACMVVVPACRALGSLPVGSLSMSPLAGPELPILLLLAACMALGVTLGARRARRRRPPKPHARTAPTTTTPTTTTPTTTAVAASTPATATTEAPAPVVAGWLIAIDGPPIRHAIESLPYRIGRAMANDLVLSDPSVSRFHAEVDLRADGAVAVTDLDSLNGVFIGGKRISQSRLFDGCRLEIGDVAFRYTREPPAIAAGGTLVFTLPQRRRS